MEKPLTMAERILTCREKIGITQKELAKSIGINRSNVSSWERGKSKPSTKTLVKLAKVLGVSTNYLLGIDGDTLNVTGLTYKKVFSLSYMVNCLKEQKD